MVNFTAIKSTQNLNDLIIGQFTIESEEQLTVYFIMDQTVNVGSFVYN